MATDLNLILMGIFSAREIPCGFLSVDVPDFAAAPTSAVMPDMLHAVWRFALVAAQPASPLSFCQRWSVSFAIDGQCAVAQIECRLAYASCLDSRRMRLGLAPGMLGRSTDAGSNKLNTRLLQANQIYIGRI